MKRWMINRWDDLWEPIWDRFCWLFIGLAILAIGVGLLAAELFLKKNSMP